MGTGDNVLIGGLIIGNGEQPLIVVRAIGPTLSSSGITQPLQDPTLEVRDANGGLIAFDNDWQDNTPTAVKAALLQPQDTREAAVVLAADGQLHRNRAGKEWDDRCRVSRSLPLIEPVRGRAA